MASSRSVSSIPYDIHRFDEKWKKEATAKKVATISLKLPDTPVNIYMDGALIKANVSKHFEMVTPELPEGSFKYRLIIQDSADKSKVGAHELNVSAGKNISADLRSAI